VSSLALTFKAFTSRTVAGSAGLGALALIGCANLETVAPPVSSVSGASTALAEGRRIFLVQCTACHAPEPVAKYNRARWQQIVTEMTNDANLSTHQESALREYLAAVAQP
jgi:mono/diheme cytochrome c family protein